MITDVVGLESYSAAPLLRVSSPPRRYFPWSFVLRHSSLIRIRFSSFVISPRPPTSNPSPPACLLHIPEYTAYAPTTYPSAPASNTPHYSPTLAIDQSHPPPDDTDPDHSTPPYQTAS